jgi:hypothetical protein
MRGQSKSKVPPVIQDAKNKPAFEFQCVTEIPHVSPLAQTVCEFDWEAVFRNESGDDDPEINHGQIAEQLGQILQWLVRGRDLKIIGRRAVALAWTVSPEMFSHVNPKQLSKLLGFKVENLPSEKSECGDSRKMQRVP